MTKLSCPLCLQPHFEGADALRSTLIFAATSEITCPVCQDTLKGLDKLTIHLFTHIASAKGNTPLREQDGGSSAILKAPDSGQHVDNLATGTGIEEEISHAQIELANERRTMRCDICNFRFSDANILDMHQKLLHQTLEDSETGTVSYHCHLCSKKFKTKGSLMLHLRMAHYGFGHNKNADIELVHSLEKLKTTENVDLPPNIAVANDNDTSKKWACDVCNKFFTTKYFLKKHKRLHTGEMPYFCSQCNKSFTFQQSYRKHMLYHSSEKPHICGECGRAFKELSTLHNHERIHSGERPFGCETCGKCFRQRVSYLVHKRIHTGVMPYVCNACGKTFRYKVSQRSHKCPATSRNCPLSPETGSKGLQSITANASNPTTICSPGRIEILPNPATNVNIIFDASGQIIGQNFTFDGTNFITYATHIAPIDNAMKCVDNALEIKPNQLETINQNAINQLIYGSDVNLAN